MENIAINQYKIDMTIINQLIFEKYCKQKNVQVFVLKYNDVLDIKFLMNKFIIKTIIKSSNYFFSKI